jgi:hypothetical protein
MGATTGLVTAAVQLGVEAILVKPKRQIGAFHAQVTIREVHTDELEITDQPVEEGSLMSDHAFKRPAEVVIECAWSNSPQNAGLIAGLAGAVTGTIGGIADILSGNGLDQVRDVYDKLLALQASRVRSDVFTGKRVYTDMLIKSLTTVSDKTTENLLKVTAVMRQIIVAQVQVVNISAPAEDQADPQSTMPSMDKGLKSLIPDPHINMSAAIDALTPSGLRSVLP